MRAVRYHEGGGPDVLEFETIDRPEPGPEELLVEVVAASINPVDAKRRQAGAGILPKTTGSDFAGIVREVGEDITGFDPGDRVFGTGLHADRFQGGSFAEFVVVPRDIVAALPDSVSFADGAGVALVGVTAWRALVDHAELKPGESCFIHGGSGGVGHVAVQLGRIMGSSVVASAGFPAAKETVRDLGASAVIDYSSDSLLEEASDVFPDGADVVFDHRVHEYLQFDVDIAGFGGRVVIYGGGGDSVVDGRAPRGKELAMHWMSMSNAVNRKGRLPPISSILTELAELMDRGALRVEIAREYELSEAAAMHDAVLNESFVGKLILTVE